MKAKDIVNNTDDSRTYKAIRWLHLALTGKINCSICRPHKCENSDHRTDRSWKNHRRNQYK